MPPAPLVCMRSPTQVNVRPRHFEPDGGDGGDESAVKPSWYAVFACQATPINSKARINDYWLLGCGELVPASAHMQPLTITGLVADQKYVFAVAAYDANGTLIESIGDSTEPILAANPLSILKSWTFLCQARYNKTFKRSSLVAEVNNSYLMCNWNIYVDRLSGWRV